jgi:cell division protein FtsB
MRSLIVVTFFMMLFLAFSARHQSLRSTGAPMLVHSKDAAETRIRSLEAERDELKRELERLDLEIAKIRSE